METVLRAPGLSVKLSKLRGGTADASRVPPPWQPRSHFLFTCPAAAGEQKPLAAQEEVRPTIPTSPHPKEEPAQGEDICLWCGCDPILN